MSKQKGIIKLEGKVGDLTFFKTRYGYLARETAALSPERIAKDPAFQRTRENNAEFAVSAKAAKLLRKTVNAFLQNVKDGTLVSRLNSIMMKLVKSDPISPRGQRNAAMGQAALLKGFEFNSNANLGTNLKVEITTQVDRAGGKLHLHLPSFIPKNQVNIPEGASHFEIISVGLELDFAAEAYVVEESSTGILPWNSDDTGNLTLTNIVTAASALPLFVMAGLRFYQQVNGINYPLKTGEFNSLSIVQVDTV